MLTKDIGPQSRIGYSRPAFKEQSRCQFLAQAVSWILNCYCTLSLASLSLFFFPVVSSPQSLSMSFPVSRYYYSRLLHLSRVLLLGILYISSPWCNRKDSVVLYPRPDPYHTPTPSHTPVHTTSESGRRRPTGLSQPTASVTIPHK